MSVNPILPTLTHIGEYAVADFMARFWQQEAYLARQALPEFRPLLDVDDVLRLSTQEDVESRLIISHDDGSWDVQYGPFASRMFKKMPASGWTILVQGVNLWSASVEAFLRQFAFIPYARLDDVMISYAVDGGGVGPHFDSYDVFLLQAYGQRRWSVGTQEDLTLVQDAPLKILQSFEPEHSWVLDPGDMLYLPPRYAHDGVAVGECMTYSIGFRVPTNQEWGQGFLNFWHDQIDLQSIYQDAGLKPTDVPASIPNALQEHVLQAIGQMLWSKKDIHRFVGCYLTEPKETVFFEPPSRPMSLKRFTEVCLQTGLVLDAKTQMLYDNEAFYCNGEAWPKTTLSEGMQCALCELSNLRRLRAEALESIPELIEFRLYEAYRSGFLR